MCLFIFQNTKPSHWVTILGKPQQQHLTCGVIVGAVTEAPLQGSSQRLKLWCYNIKNTHLKYFSLTLPAWYAFPPLTATEWTDKQRAASQSRSRIWRIKTKSVNASGQLIVFRIYHLGAINAGLKFSAKPYASRIDVEIFHRKWKLRPAGEASGKVRRSPKSVHSWMSGQNFMSILPVVVEIFHSGPKWRTDRPTLPSIAWLKM